MNKKTSIPISSHLKSMGAIFRHSGEMYIYNSRYKFRTCRFLFLTCISLIAQRCLSYISKYMYSTMRIWILVCKFLQDNHHPLSFSLKVPRIIVLMILIMMTIQITINVLLFFSFRKLSAQKNYNTLIP